MPWTWATMGLAALSLIGFPLFSGFWSKDEVLAVSIAGASPVLSVFAFITVFLTAFYTFRMFFLTFHGAYRGGPTEEHHQAGETTDPHQGALHESDVWMVAPLVVLAVPAVLVGFWGAPPPFGANGFQHFLEGASYEPVPVNLTSAAVGAILAIVGLIVAWVMYGARAFSVEPLARLGAVYTLLWRRYYIDEFYMWLIDKLAIGLAAVIAIFDRQGLDGVVNGIASLVARMGQALRGMQTGRVQNYGLVLFGGMAVIAVAVIFLPLVGR
jgi:NADH-quinone oxidoreductase subunit L